MARDDAEAQVLSGREQEPAHRLAPRPRVGKPPQDEADRGVDRRPGRAPIDSAADDAALDAGSCEARTHVDVGDAGSGHGPLGDGDDCDWRPTRRAPTAPQREQASTTTTPASGRRAQQRARRARLGRLVERLLQPGSPRRAVTPSTRLAGQLVDVRRRQHEHAARRRRVISDAAVERCQSTGPAMPSPTRSSSDPPGAVRALGRTRAPARAP